MEIKEMTTNYEPMLALQDIKIIDIGRYLPAAYCTQILGDMGANVLKIEEPIISGSRRGGSGVSVAPGKGAEERAAYDFFNRNKRSVILNLKSEEAIMIFRQLAKKADVIVENMRPGNADRLGIDYRSISKENPRIVYCSISGYGQNSPYRLVAGHDPNYCSIAGAQALNVDHKGKPVKFGIPLADIGTALHATIGILLALFSRNRTSRGQFIDISMTDSVFSFMSRALRGMLYPDVQYTNTRNLVDVALGPQEVKDGKFITTANLEPYFWERFCKALDRQDLIPHQYAVKETANEVCSTIQQIFLTKSREEWIEILRQADTAVAPVLDINEVLSDPHILQRKLVMEIDHPILGKVKQLGFPIRLSETPARFRSFAPFAGQHTEEVLRELGYAYDDIMLLKKKAVVQ